MPALKNMASSPTLGRRRGDGLFWLLCSTWSMAVGGNAQLKVKLALCDVLTRQRKSQFAVQTKNNVYNVLAGTLIQPPNGFAAAGIVSCPYILTRV